MKIYFFLLILLFFGAGSLSAAERKWTLNSGKSFMAKVIKVENEKATFQRGDGKKKTIPIAKLKRKDARYLYYKLVNLPDFTSPRIWKPQKGRKIKGQLLAVDSLKVYLKKSSGKKTAISRNALSKKDRAYVEDRLFVASEAYTDKVKNAAPDKDEQLVQPQGQPQPQPQAPAGFNQQQFQMNNKQAAGIMAVAGVAILIMLGLNCLFYTICLWAAKAITHCETSFVVLLMSSIVGSLISLIPVFGLLLPGPIQILMIMGISKTSFVDTLFMVVVGNILFVVISLLALAKIMGAIA